MACTSCAERRALLAAAGRKVKAGDMAGAVRLVGETAKHLVAKPWHGKIERGTPKP